MTSIPYATCLLGLLVLICSATPINSHGAFEPTVVLQNVPDGQLGLVALSRDTRMLATLNNNALKLWDIASGLLIREEPMGAGCNYRRLSFLDQDRKIAAGCLLEKTRQTRDTVIELSTQKRIEYVRESAQQGGEGGEGMSISLAGYSPDGEFIVQRAAKYPDLRFLDDPKIKRKEGPAPALQVIRVRDGVILKKLSIPIPLFGSGEPEHFLDEKMIVLQAPEQANPTGYGNGELKRYVLNIETGEKTLAPLHGDDHALMAVNRAKTAFIYRSKGANNTREWSIVSATGAKNPISLPSGWTTEQIQVAAFTQDESKIALQGFDAQAKVSAWLTINASTGERLDSKRSVPIIAKARKDYFRLDYSPVNSGRWLIRQEDFAAPELWDAEKGSLVRKLGVALTALNQVRWSPNGRYIAIGKKAFDENEGAIQIWDLATARVTKHIPLRGFSALDFHFSPDNHALLLRTARGFSNQQPGLMAYDLESGASTRRFSNLMVSKVLPTRHEKWLVLINQPAQVAASQKNEHSVSVVEADSGSVVFKAEIGNDYQNVPLLETSPDGQQLYWLDRSGTPKFVELGQWQVKPLNYGKYPREGAVNSPAAYYAARSVDEDNLQFYKPGQSRAFFKTTRSWVGYSVPVFSPDGTRMAMRDEKGVPTLYSADLADKKLKIIRSLAGPGEPAAFAHFWSPDGKFLLDKSDGVLALRNGKTGELIATLTALEQNDSVVSMPGGEYLATKAALKSVGFSVGLTPYTFDQFDLKFNRPDVVLKAIGLAPQKWIDAAHRAYQKRLSKAGFTEAMLATDYHLPSVSIDRTQLPTATRTAQIALKVTAKDEQIPLDRLFVTVNEVPFDGLRNGIDLRKAGEKEVTRQIEVPLLPGANRIQVSVRNAQGAESYRETVEIRGDMPVVPGRVFALTVGVSTYQNQAFNLKYAAKDAKDVGDLFGKATRFTQPNIIPVLDQQATRDNILKAREALLAANPSDTLVVFLAGHGLLDDKLDYYFATTDIDFEQPARSGLSYDDIEGLLDGVKARKKLLLMDTCNSGELDKGEFSPVAQDLASSDGALAFPGKVKARAVGTRALKKKPDLLASDGLSALISDLFADMRRGSGAVAISSAGGAEFALESDEWKNGVFTFALLQGLKSKSADKNKDGVVTASELRDAVLTRVPELTQGKQTPTTRRENLSYDFAVY